MQVFNDDKPALRRLDGRWYAYGTPWCGKDGINLNQKWPLGGICFLEKSQENRIRRLPAAEALPLILAQTTYRLQPHSMELLLASLDSLLREIPVFLLENRPEEAAARLSFETMRRAAEEAQRLSDALNAQGIPACASMHAQGQGLCIQILLKNERLS